MRALSRLCLLVCCTFAGGVLGSSLETANRLFDEGKFSEARVQYQQLVDSGSRDANTFYNLGNANYRLGATGLAVLNYERALVLDPAHPEARANVTLAREQSGASVPERTWADRLVMPLTANVFAIIAAATFWAGAILLTWVLVRRRGRALSWMTLFLLWSVTAYSVAAAWRLSRDSALAIVLTREADARLAPADRAALAEKLRAGSRVRVLSERGAWTYCELPGNGRGWLPSTALEKVYLPSA